MAKIEDLSIGAAVRWTDSHGITMKGKVTGRRMSGRVEGWVNATGLPHAPDDEPDQVQITFPRFGVPPETVAVSCGPESVELISDPAS